MANLISYEQVKNHAKYRQALTLQTFESVEAVDAVVAAFLTLNDVSKSEYAVLIHLARHSIKAFGVSWGRVPYIAEMVELSERTVQRCLSSLEAKGIIQRVESFRTDGGRDGNFIVILPQEDATIDAGVVAGGETAEPASDKASDVVFSGEAVQSFESCKSIKSLESEKEKRIDDEEYALTREVAYREFYNSNFYKYGIQELVEYAVKTDVPLPIFSQLNKALLSKYENNYAQFANVDRNDLISAVWKAVDTFNERFRKGHNISSYGAFFETLFTKEINRRIVVRSQASREDVYTLIA